MLQTRDGKRLTVAEHDQGGWRDAGRREAAWEAELTKLGD